MSSSEKETNNTPQVIIKDSNVGSTVTAIVSLVKLLILIAVILFIAMAVLEKPSKIGTSYSTNYENYNKYFEDMKQFSVPVTDKTKAVTYSKTVFLLDFNGSSSGNEVDKLKRDIDFILLNSNPGDEVALRLKSPGGSVNTYGLAASELSRFKPAGLTLTVLVDQVAASGGYMMAVIGDKIISAPFAFVGSVGVVAQLPIYEDFLKTVGVEYKVYTAGDHKRSVVSQIKPTIEDEDKLREDLQKIHVQFKNHVKKYRPNLDIDRIANGQVFSGQEALELKLVDELSTSSDYLLKQYKKNAKILYVYTEENEDKSSSSTLKTSVDTIVDSISTKIVEQIKGQVYDRYENIQLK